ncbi:CGNR zinc finger domain-containing protein [Nocardioides cavernaquae]|uniref:RNA-binding protein n=1 Tax=Nocardioides cavernaquae TaxID=2321396 RepID=A0A3A5HGW3_9ACTN|nr:CGNR zinc finger domain-containing protein [Nocardioides cavernaquae]RJS46917.1 RNA-binding protein [Nocardioides cavernaquae]
MLFAHDTEMNLLAAVTLVNSRYSNPMDVDRMADAEDLDNWFREHSYSYAPAATAELVEEVTALREPLHSLFTSTRDGAVDRVNAWLAEADALPRLVRHDDLDWHIHAEPPGSSLRTQILVETAMAMIDVIRSDEMQRLSVCDDENCDGIVLDLSRNRSRRYCSTACGNRAAVAAYRARQAGG